MQGEEKQMAIISTKKITKNVTTKIDNFIANMEHWMFLTMSHK